MAENITTIFGNYVAITEVVAQPAQDELIALLTELKTLFPDPDTAPANRGDNAGGNFDQIAPQVSHQMRGEIDAIVVVIDAAPIA